MFMSKPTEINIKALLKNAAQLQLKELESFAKELNKLIHQKKKKGKKYQEKKLLSQLNKLILSKEEQEQYHLLSLKLESETISAEEQKIYTALITKEEQLRNERVKILIRLSQLKSVSLLVLMKDLGLNKVKRA